MCIYDSQFQDGAQNDTQNGPQNMFLSTTKGLRDINQHENHQVFNIMRAKCLMRLQNMSLFSNFVICMLKIQNGTQNDTQNVPKILFLSKK